jgi:MFS transporter, DHA1 family, multidrug resistance protein
VNGLETKYTRAYYVLFVLFPFLMGMGVDSYVPSLPAIRVDFSSTPHVVQWTIVVYMFGYAAGQLILGIMADTKGRRPIVLWGGLAYILASVGAAWSPSIGGLILCRGIQGFAIAGPAVALRAVPSDCAQGHERAKMMTTLTTSWALGPVLGPFIGSYLAHAFGWRSNFYFLAGFGAVATLLGVFWMKETLVRPIRFQSAILAQNLRTILCHRQFQTYVWVASTVYATLVIFNGVGPFLIQVDLHYSVIVYGRIALLLGLAYFLGTMTVRLLLKRVSIQSFSRLGSRATLICALVFWGIHLWIPMSLGSIVLPCACLFYACGLLFPSLMSQVSGIFPQMGGTASAMYGAMLSFGVVAVTSLVSLLPTQTVLPLAITYSLLHMLGWIGLKREGSVYRA